MRIVNGNKIAEKIIETIKPKIQEIAMSKKRPLGLAVILVGQSPESRIFIKKKQEIAEKLGVFFKLFQFAENISSRTLRKNLKIICQDYRFDGIIIQLPLPKSLNEQYLLDAIPEKKDIDVLSSKSLGKFYTGRQFLMPPVAGAVLRIFDEYAIKIKAKNIVILGAGRLVGKPLSLELLRRGATISILNSKTPKIENFIRKADIVISGVGKPNLIKAEILKKGVIVIDAGLAVLKKGKNRFSYLGDVDSEGIEKKIALLSPMPGGVGPITVAVLFENLLKLANLSPKVRRAV